MKKIILILIIAAVAIQVVDPPTLNPQELSPTQSYDNTFPVALEIPEKFTLLTNQIVYGYNSEEAQTDNSPCITASGLDICKNTSINIIANNCLPFSSDVVVNDVSYSVQDRMNSRYDCNTWDIWFPTYEEARNWGKRTINVKIYE